MAFTFQPYSSPLTNSIAERIGQAGAIEAQRAYATGNAAANAALQSGNAWSGAIQGVGQAIGALPGQIAALQGAEQNRAIRAQQLQAGQIQLDNAKRDQQAQQAQATLLQGNTLPPGVEGPQRPSMLDESGLLDPGKIGAAYAALGFGDKVPDILHAAGLQNDAIKSYRATQKQLATDKVIAAGTTAHGVLTLMQAGIPIDQAFEQAGHGVTAEDGGVFSPADYAKVTQQILALPPEQQQPALEQLRNTAARLLPTKTDKEGDITHDAFGRVVSKGGEKPKSFQTKNVLLDGKPAEVVFDPATGTSTYNQQPVDPTRIQPIPTDVEAQQKLRYRTITSNVELGLPVSPEDKAFAKAFEKEKLLGPEASAAAAATRLDSAQSQQNKIQESAQTFSNIEKARAEISKTADQPYATAQSGADTLRDTVHAAMAGNKVAGSLQTLEATMGALRSQGFNRINTAEIGATGNAGSLWDNINSYIGKKAEGQPIPANIQKDMLAFADILDQAAAKKYVASHDAANKLYGTNIPRTYTVPTGGAAPGAGAGPDLSGLTAGHGRTFNAGPYAGQTWTIGPDGKPKQVS